MAGNTNFEYKAISYDVSKCPNESVMGSGTHQCPKVTCSSNDSVMQCTWEGDNSITLLHFVFRTKKFSLFFYWTHRPIFGPPPPSVRTSFMNGPLLRFHLGSTQAYDKGYPLPKQGGGTFQIYSKSTQPRFTNTTTTIGFFI